MLGGVDEELLDDFEYWDLVTMCRVVDQLTTEKQFTGLKKVVMVDMDVDELSGLDWSKLMEDMWKHWCNAFAANQIIFQDKNGVLMSVIVDVITNPPQPYLVVALPNVVHVPHGVDAPQVVEVPQAIAIDEGLEVLQIDDTTEATEGTNVLETQQEIQAV